MQIALHEFVALQFGDIVEFVSDGNNPKLQVFTQEEIWGPAYF